MNAKTVSHCAWKRCFETVGLERVKSGNCTFDLCPKHAAIARENDMREQQILAMQKRSEDTKDAL